MRMAYEQIIVIIVIVGSHANNKWPTYVGFVYRTNSETTRAIRKL